MHFISVTGYTCRKHSFSILIRVYIVQNMAKNLDVYNITSLRNISLFETIELFLRKIEVCGS